MKRAVRIVAWLLLVATGLWLFTENRRLEASRIELARQLAQQREEHDSERAAQRAAVTRLEEEVRIAIGMRDAFVATLDGERADLARQRDERRAELLRATTPPPEGVRLALATIEDLLRGDGHDGVRFLRAAALVDHELRSVEILETRPGMYAPTLYIAERVQFDLDRSVGALTIRAFEGRVFGDGVDREIGVDGEALTFGAIDAEAWEARLPFLVRVIGVAPAATVAEDKVVGDPSETSMWIERLDALFARARTDVGYRIGRLRAVQDGRFTGVLVHGYDDGRRLVTSLRAASLEIVVDDSVGADSVELLLRDGVLLRSDGEVEIPQSGYRILLPGIDASAARDLMLGLVTAR